MREISFRGKRVDNGEWVYGQDILQHQGRVFIQDFDSCEKEYLVSAETVGQYTGLIDKNGKEIYEGDILRLWKSNSPKGFRGEYVKPLPVIYDENWCQFVVEDKDNKKYFGIWQDFDGYEVIGNIYDNPTLLEE